MKQRFIVSFGLAFLVLLASIPIVLPYFKTGYFPTHDGEWAVVRLADMFRTLKDFQFPPRYSGALNFGYGYPLFNFAYPFPYYLGTILYFPFHSFIWGLKSVFILSVFLSGFFMYLASAKLWSNRISGFVSSILYLYLPYRMVDLYVRGSVGESLSLALFPLIFYLSLKLFDASFKRPVVILLSLFIGTLVMTHNIMTVLFMPVLILFIMIRIITEKRFDVLQSFLLCIGLGAGVSAFFWFPALFEKSMITLSKIPIADRNLYFVNINQVVFPNWGYAPPTEANGFSYQLGIAQIISVLTAFGILFLSFIKNKFNMTPLKKYALVLLVIYIIYFLMMFSFTGVIWRTVPLLSEINYPWTILSQLGFITAFLSGFLVIEGRYLKYFSLTIALLSFFLTINYAKPEKYNANYDSYYITNEATTTSSDELMPVWVKQKPFEHFHNKVEVVNGQASVSNLSYNSKFIKFDFKADQDTVFAVNTIYYPGWNAYVNGILTKIDYNNPKGVMQIAVDKYNNKVYLEFGETLTRIISDCISIISILVLLFILLRPILLFNNEK